jgi:hypothetical protein
VFATYRFQQINDNLIESYIRLVDDYERQAKAAAEIDNRHLIDRDLATVRQNR